MRIGLCRVLYIICLAWVFYWDVNKMVIGYAFVMWAASEILNSNDTYKQFPHYKLHNALFVGLLYATTIDRSRNRKEVLPAIWEFRIDICIHFLFTITIILLCCILAVVFFKKKEINKTKLVLMAAIAFNLIGVVNEFYQNIFNTRNLKLFDITDEAKLDLTVNLVSSVICIGIAYWFPKCLPGIHEKETVASS